MVGAVKCDVTDSLDWRPDVPRQINVVLQSDCVVRVLCGMSVELRKSGGGGDRYGFALLVDRQAVLICIFIPCLMHGPRGISFIRNTDIAVGDVRVGIMVERAAGDAYTDASFKTSKGSVCEITATDIQRGIRTIAFIEFNNTIDYAVFNDNIYGFTFSAVASVDIECMTIINNLNNCSVLNCCSSAIV